MVVIKNINADVHLIDYNMYMFMMKYNYCKRLHAMHFKRGGKFEFEPKYQCKVIYFLALLPPPSPLSNFRIKELTGQ